MLKRVRELGLIALGVLVMLLVPMILTYRHVDAEVRLAACMEAR